MENNNREKIKSFIKNKRKEIIKYSCIFLVTVVFIGIAGGWMVNSLMEEIIHKRKEVIVPDVRGMTINDALGILTDKNLSMTKVAEKFDTEIPAGSIISQSPPPGLIVREGKAIETVISSGGKVVFAPEVEGKSLRQAELLLRQSSLNMGEQVRTYSNNIKRDHIVSQDPPPGEIVEKNSYVNVVVSRGPAEEEKIRKMPNLLGMRIGNVKKIVKEQGFEVTEISTTVNRDLPEGTVVAQEPNQNNIVDENTDVKVTITKLPGGEREVWNTTIYYEVPQTGKEKEIRIVLEDAIGSREVFSRVEKGGSKIEVPVKVLGRAKVKIFTDDILVKEEELEYKEEEQEENKD
ncbi:MAG: PASTA domain-containing protein [Elusimicrobiota bacterium]